MFAFGCFSLSAPASVRESRSAACHAVRLLQLLHSTCIITGMDYYNVWIDYVHLHWVYTNVVHESMVFFVWHEYIRQACVQDGSIKMIPTCIGLWITSEDPCMQGHIAQSI